MRVKSWLPAVVALGLLCLAPGGSYNPVPAGGTTNQVLSKKSNSDFDLQWATSSSGEPALGSPASDGWLLSSTAAGVRSWKNPATLIINNLADSTDPTKTAVFDLSGKTTGTQSTIKVGNGTLVIPLAVAAVSHQFVTSIPSTGTPTLAQPAIADVSDATTAGQNLVKVTNPGAISFPKFAADNSVSTRTPAQVLSDIGAQASGSYALTSSGNTLTGNQTINEAAGGSGLTITGATQTTSKPVINLTQTWNAGGVTFTGLKFNLTDTASASGSLFFDFQIGGVSKFYASKAGRIYPLPGGGVGGVKNAPAYSFNDSNGKNEGFDYDTNNNFAYYSKAGAMVFGILASGTALNNSGYYAWGSGGDAGYNVDAGLYRNAAGIVEVNNGSAGSYRDLYLRDIKTQSIGGTLSVKSGANAKAGTFTLSSGTATVSNTSVTANSVVACTVKTSSGTLGTGTPEIVITASTGFTATGVATDNSTYNFVIFEVN